MKRLSLFAVALAFVAAGCSKSSTSPSTATKPTFTADLRPANEVPAITNAESSGSGTVTVTFDTTKDAGGNILTSSATFVVNLTGFPAGTAVTAAHIHPGAAGVNGSPVVNLSITAGEFVLATGAGSITKTVSGVDAALTQQIINNPAGYYFNVHSALNGGGFARGQLRAQ
jgi:CHRD domain